MTGRNAKIENGQPRITPVAATATAHAGFSRRNNPDERLMAYIENELGRKPGKKFTVIKVKLREKRIFLHFLIKFKIAQEDFLVRRSRQPMKNNTEKHKNKTYICIQETGEDRKKKLLTCACKETTAS